LNRFLLIFINQFFFHKYELELNTLYKLCHSYDSTQFGKKEKEMRYLPNNQQ
jgi:hypothetical protein